MTFYHVSKGCISGTFFSLMICSYNLGEKHVSLLSIPGDNYVLHVLYALLASLFIMKLSSSLKQIEIHLLQK